MIFTLCGSAKFEKEFKEWSLKLFEMGHPCFTLAVYPSDSDTQEKNWYTPEQKNKLDLLHFEKIKNSDAVIILNVDGYVGESTLKEIQYARMLAKMIYWLETTDMAIYTEVTADHILNLWK